MGNDNIIDFDSYKRSREPEPIHTPHEAEALASINAAFGAYLHAFSKNDLMLDVHARVGERFARLEIIESVSDRVCETITAAGMDPGNFRIDPVAFERFQTREIDLPSELDAEDEGWPIPPELYWNGPYYDWNDQGTLFRAATTVLRHKTGEVELLVDLVKLGEDKHWLMWHDGVWEPDDFLEAVEEELRRRQIEALGPAAIGYDDDVVDIFTLSLSLRVVTALCEGGIMTVRELCEMTEEKLLDIWGIGPKAVIEIKEALEEEGLSLREE